MPLINKVPHKKITINLQGGVGIPSTDANILLIGHRSGVISGNDVNYPQLKPKAGYPLLTAYRSYALPGFSDGDAALSYMQALGFKVNYGSSNSMVLSAPDRIISSGLESANKQRNNKKQLADNVPCVILEWDNAPAGFDLLMGNNEEIQISQYNNVNSGVNTETEAKSAITAAVARVQKVKQNPYQLVLANAQGVFTAQAQVGVNYIDSSANIPDPARSDEICLMVYNAVNSINTNFPQTLNTITPTVNICFLNPTDNGFSPNSAAVTYVSGGKNAGLSEVKTLANGNTGIYFTAAADNFGITPTQALGNTIISKTPDSGVSGTLVQILPGITSAGIGIELTNVNGKFAVGDAVSISLDSSQDVFSLLTASIQYPVSPYEIKIQADISSPSSKFVPLFNYLTKANAPTSVNNESFFAMGVAANLSIPKQQAGSLPVFDPSTFGAEYITGAYYPYSAKLGDYPLTAAMAASSYAGVIACNDVPFNPLNNVLLKLPAAADLTAALNDLSSITTVINLGWTPIGVNARQQAYIVRAVTGLLYLPGAQAPDNEYFPVTDWQIIGLWKKAVFQALSQPAFTNRRKSIQLKDSILNALQPLALSFEKRGMFYNMAKLVNEFAINDDAEDAAKYDVVTPICVTPEFNAIEITVNVVSYLAQITTTA